jgi:hypothetical protein
MFLQGTGETWVWEEGEGLNERAYYAGRVHVEKWDPVKQQFVLRWLSKMEMHIYNQQKVQQELTLKEKGRMFTLLVG